MKLIQNISVWRLQWEWLCDQTGTEANISNEIRAPSTTPQHQKVNAAPNAIYLSQQHVKLCNCGVKGDGILGLECIL